MPIMILHPHQPVLDLINVLAKKNVRHAVLCPGSRCAPLVLALVRHPLFICHTFTDERTAAYAALGMAQQHTQPVVLVCTSGTAALNFAPAIAEAYHQNIPLIILTADRPTEWIHQEDGQAINQTDLYKNFVVQSHTLPAHPHPTPAQRHHAQRITNQAANACATHQQPVHINVPLHEPLYNLPQNVIVDDIKIINETINEHHIAPSFFDDFHKNTLFIIGQNPPNIYFVAAIKQILHNNPTFAAFAEPTSNCPLPQVIFNAEKIINKTYHTIVCLGASTINKKIKQHLRQNPPTKLYNIGKKNAHADAFTALTHIIHGTLHATPPAAAIAPPPPNIDLQKNHPNNLLQILFQSLPHSINLHLANSLSVRWAGAFAHNLLHKNINVYSNRGTSGIDGCTSTAIGAAIANPDKKNILITGDLAFVYDSNALWNKYNPKNLIIIILNNGGGGIFSMLDAVHQPEFNDYFFTPNTANIPQLCAAFGAKHTLFDHTNPDNFQDFQEFINDFFVKTKKSTATSVLEIAVD